MIVLVDIRAQELDPSLNTDGSEKFLVVVVLVVCEKDRVPLANCFLALRWHAESARSARRSQPGPNPAGGNPPRPDGLKNVRFFSVSG